MPERGRGRTALVAVSRPGSELALRLERGIPEAEVFLPERFSPTGEDVYRWSGPARDLLGRLFSEFAGLVLFGSVGMAVRLVAPLLVDKRADPAVVVVDDAGRFAVSVLSGHLGGANALARRVADALGAQAVITTASDALGTLAVDLLGRELGWRIEDPDAVTRASAAVVNGEPVGVLQEAGEPDWWPAGEPLPANLVVCSSRDELAASLIRAALVITDQTLVGWEERLPPTVVYRPKSLVVGVGCNRGTPAMDIAGAVDEALERHGLARASIRNLVTLDLKRDEAGIGELAAELGVPVEHFPAEELDRVAGVASPSAVVQRWVGTRGVCEPAALLSSGATALLVSKHKTQNVTVAVARVDFTRRRGGQREGG